MKITRTKVALIGVGYWGQNLARVFSQLKALDTICDSSPENLARAKRDYPKVKISPDHSGILNDKTIGAVVIATPAEFHYQLVKESLLSGKDVFVEKPMALTAEEGSELVSLAEKSKKILMVGHLLEYHPAVNKLKEFVEQGKLGKIQYIYSNRLNLGKFRREENILWSFAPHDISIILLLMNETPEGVSVYGGNYLNHGIADVTVSNLSFSNGVKGHIFVSWLHPYKEQKLVVVGDKAMAVFDDTNEKDKLLIFNHKINWIGRMPVPHKKEAEPAKFKMEEPLVLECRHFLNSVATRKNPKTDGRSALRVLKVLQACQVSLEKGGTYVPISSVGSCSGQPNSYYAHPTAVIEQPSQVGDGTKIWHYSHIMKGAKIGKNCIIGQNVFIGAKAELGNNVKVQNNVSIYDGVRVEDDVFCGPSVVFTNVINPRSFIERKKEFKKTVIRKGATLGANATILCGIAVNEYAFVGAGAVVTRDVPAYALVYGAPAKLRGWMCTCGVKLEFKGKSVECDICGKKYVADNEAVVAASV